MSRQPEGGGDSQSDNGTAGELSRREFLEGTGAALVVAAAVPSLGATSAADAAVVQAPPTGPSSAIRVVVNGTEHEIEVEDRWTLVELLRDHLGLTGTKIGCNRSECGACTVLMDGKPVYSCSQLAVWTNGRTIETVEGLARGGEPSPVQEAFMDHNGPQCGFCTPGQLMTATALLQSNPRPSSDEVRSALVGNLCRCSNYNAIVEAVVAAGVENGGGA